MAERLISDAERRARIGRLHALAPGHRVATPEQATRAMTLLHATEAASVHLSVAARTEGATVEDTDRARSTPEATAAILDGLTWLGLDWDGEPTSQFERADRHAEVARAMIERGTAYRCYSTVEEIEAFREKAKADGKPEKILDKVVEGQVQKFLAESCLVDQAFVKDPDVTVAKLLEKIGKELGTTLEIKSVHRFKVGEGIEKKADDFAAEVAKMAGTA